MKSQQIKKQMTKNKLKEILIAALIGASITFLTHILEGLIGVQKNMSTSLLGGGVSFMVYFKRVVMSIV